MGDRRRHVPQGAESFRVRQRPIVLGECVGSSPLTLAAITEEALRVFDSNRQRELTLGLRPEAIAAVAGEVSHRGLNFQDVSAVIKDQQLHLSGRVKKGPLTLFRGQIVVANGECGLEIVNGSLGPLTRLAGDFNGIMTSQMGQSLGPEFTVDQVQIARDILTARVTRGQPQRRAA